MTRPEGITKMTDRRRYVVTAMIGIEVGRRGARRAPGMRLADATGDSGQRASAGNCSTDAR